MGKRFVIKAPAGTKIQTKYKGADVMVELKWNPDFVPKREDGFSRAQKYVDSECIRRMAPETPFRTGVLRKSATMGTTIGSGEINQIAPYARRQYYEHEKKSRWFERMKNRHKDQILEGARKIAGK